MPTKQAASCQRKNWALDSFTFSDRCRHRMAQRTQPAPESPFGTIGGQEIRKTRRMIELENEVRLLHQLMNQLICHIDPNDIQAARLLSQFSPSNAELKIWAQESLPPSHLADQPEERPW